MMRHLILTTFFTLFHVSTGSENEALHQIYRKFDKKSTILTRNICIYAFIAVPILYAIPIAIKSYNAFYTANRVADTLQLVYFIE